MGIARTFTKNVLFQIGSNLATKIMSMFLLVYLTYLLLPEEYSIYAWIISMAMLANTFADFNTGDTMCRFVSASIGEGGRRKAAAYFRYLLKTRLAALAGVAAFLVLFADILATMVFQKPFLAAPIRVCAVFLIFYNLVEYFQALFVTMKRMEFVFGAMLLQGASKVILMVGLVLLFNSYLSAIAGYAAAVLLSGIFLLYFMLRKYRYLFGPAESFDRKKLFAYMSYSVPGSFLLIILTTLDILLITYLLPMEQVGFYSIAISWSAAVTGLLPVYLLFPVFSELSARSSLENLREAFSKFFRYIMFIAVPASFGLAFFSKPMVYFIYPDAYEGAVAQLLFILSFLIIFSILHGITSVLFNAVERPHIVAKAYAAALALHLLLSLYLIPIVGAAGAAYSVLAAFIFISAVLLLRLGPATGLRPQFGAIAKPLIASALVFLAITALPNSDSFIYSIAYLAIGLVLYLLLMFLLKGISVSELKFLKNRILSRD